MPLIPYHSFFDLERFFKDDDFFPGESGLLREPRVDIYEEGDNLIVEAELPGIESDEVDVNITEDALKIEAEHKEEKEEEKKEKGYYKKELSRGYFRRAVRLPVRVKDDQAEASYEDGVLTVTMPKSEKEQQKQEGTSIEVKQG